MQPATTSNGETRTRRYRLARNFALCAILLLGGAGWVTFEVQSRLAVDHLVTLTGRHNAALTQMAGNSLWPRYGSFIDDASRLGAEAVRRHAKTAGLRAEIERLMADTSVLKVKFYDLAGHTAFSTDPAQIGADYSTNDRYLAAHGGATASKLEFRESFGAMTGPRQDVWVLSSYVPVRDARSQAVLGVAEVYADVTALYADIAGLERRLMSITGGVFTLLFALLTIIVGYAERQIRRQHLATLEQATRAANAEAASHAKSQFLANMGHELRTPLNAIIGFAQMIHGAVFGPVGEPRYREYAGDIEKSGQHLLSIIDDVLELVRLDTDRLPVRARQVNIAATAADVFRLLLPEARRRQVSLSLAPAEGDVDIVSDDSKVRQILINLVFNALKFTPSGGNVAIRVGRDAGGLRVTVEDDGIGMSADDIVIALQPFGQVKSSQLSSEPGTGLGLPLSQRLAETLGGRLDLDSSPGAGTRVTLLLPAGEARMETERLAG